MSLRTVNLANKIVSKLNIFFGVILACFLLYFVTAFGEVPGLRDLRNLWVETAMTTADHMWLAERLFPASVIDRIMANAIDTEGIVSDHDSGLVIITTPSPTPEPTRSVDTIPVLQPTATPEPPPTPEPTPTIQVGDEDEFGNKIIVFDEAQDIKIVEISGVGYRGRLLFVTDPSRVVVRSTDYKNARGEFLSTYLEKYDGIAGINANGFADPNGVGSGGNILGWTMADGELWGSRLTDRASAGFTEDNILVVGTIRDPQEFNLRDMVQWGPALIVDGKQLYTSSNTAGLGVHPRSAIGQTADGTIILATIDGRQPPLTLGITGGALSDIFYQYGCVNAFLCDGGSSAVMVYDGEVIGSPSTPMKTTGRYLPNAIIVLNKEPD